MHRTNVTASLIIVSIKLRLNPADNSIGGTVHNNSGKLSFFLLVKLGFYSFGLAQVLEESVTVVNT